jgi:serine/threonine kinase 16
MQAMEFGDGYQQRGFAYKIKDIIHAIFESIRQLFVWKSQEIRVNSRTLVIQKQLGEGGFSFVYLVKDKIDGQLYALKRVRVQLEEQTKMLKQEIQAHRLVQSRHVIPLLDSKLIQSNGSISEGLLLLPYFENGTVQNLIDRERGQLALEKICSIAHDICQGLNAFHSCNPPLAFRDLKPANVLLDSHGNAVLMDLGSVSVARVTISSRKEAVALQEYCAETVTAPFRAPELFDPPTGSTITEASDIWYLEINKGTGVYPFCDGIRRIAV